MDLPDPSRIREFCLDLETYDPDLQDLGPGFVYNRAKVVGIAVETDSGFSEYFPLRHAKSNADGSPTGWNVPGEPVLEWVRALVEDPMKTMIGWNLLYDIEGLRSLGFNINCCCIDGMILAALVDEERQSYALGNVAKDYGLEPKLKTELENALMRFPLVKNKPDWSKLWKLPPDIVGPYAKRDTALTYQLYKRLWKEIEAQDLVAVSDLESQLLPVLSMMRWRGVRIDHGKAEQENDRLNRENGELLQAIYGYVPGLNPFSPLQLGESLRERGIEPPKTEKGNDSVSNDFLLSLDDPFAKLLGKYRQQEKIRRDFIEGVILGQSYKGRVHAQFYQTRGTSFMSDNDTGGTRSGRLASSNPNLQQLPTRHPELGKLVRSMFLPDESELWCSNDYSAQEPRWTVHFASLLDCTGAMEARQAYLDNPLTDYHTMTQTMVNKVRSNPITRGQAKTMNLGMAYGMGLKKLADSLGLPQAQAREIIEAYNEGFPFIKEFLNRAMQIADQRGYVKTTLGRRRRFDSWEPQRFMRGMFPVKGYEKALAKYGPGIRKAGLHKAMNSVIQGTASDQIKTAMVMLANEGFKIIVTVHDELAISISNPSEGAKIKEIMEHALECTVPHVVEQHIGENWSCK